MPSVTVIGQRSYTNGTFFPLPDLRKDVEKNTYFLQIKRGKDILEANFELNLSLQGQWS